MQNFLFWCSFKQRPSTSFLNCFDHSSGISAWGYIKLRLAENLKLLDSFLSFLLLGVLALCILYYSLPVYTLPSYLPMSIKLLPGALLFASTLASPLFGAHEDAFQCLLGQSEPSKTLTAPPSCVINEVGFSNISPQFFADAKQQVCSAFPLTFNIGNEALSSGGDQCALEPSPVSNTNLAVQTSFNFTQWMSEQQLNANSSSPQSANASGIVGGLYEVSKKIGQGSFGVVFEGTKVMSNTPVAIKVEMNSTAPWLTEEYQLYMALNGTFGIPQVYHFGQEGLHNVLVMDLLGPSLEDLFNKCGRKFSIKTVCMLAKQMITRVQTLHEKSLIYRDIKAENFLMGVPETDNANTAHMIDLGLAKYYRDPETQVHIPYREIGRFAGSVRYLSVNCHVGREPSRRDDLEALGYVFMYFLRGRLPWQGLKAETIDLKYRKVGQKKIATSMDKLCAGFPKEFLTYLNNVRSLTFAETPDYDYLRDLFTTVLRKLNEKEDGVYDWMLLNDGQVVTNPSSKPKTRLQAHVNVVANASSESLRADREQRPNLEAQDANNSSPLVLRPAPAHAKGNLNLALSHGKKWTS
ncbi:hypothetical protein D9758_003971 [Tetrapyrgos nigripes]|uniref:non-specific serine/threonine protein kinase n=1 Tax=Tetrapyrgos nigripes TaxID=182062 RepID=A0A8H5LRR5_9AGAR|nr:hypothetical protein D9758_003971 [Tetrapyrgos nigripes]